MRTPLLACSLLSALTLVCGCDPSSAPADAAPDGAPADARPPVDTGPLEAGPLDAGPLDAGPLDAEPLDGGPFDAGGDAGSGSDDAGPTDDAGGPTCDPSTLSLEAFHEQQADGLCALYARCATYVSMPSGACSPDYRDALVPENIAELLLNADVACGCLEAMRRPTCELWGAILACSGVYRPRTPATDCSRESGCDVGQYCDRSGGVCPGTCTDVPAPGQACAGLRCALGATCVEGLCVARPELGEACANVDGERCRLELTCLPTGGPDGEGVCRGPAAAGAPCGDNAYCQAGLVCLDDVCAAGSTAGQPCGGSAECALEHYCLEGSCVRSLRPGDSCASDEECPDGFACDGVCEALPRLGEACPEGVCFLGSCTAGTCELTPTGGPCDRRKLFYRQCVEGACDSTSTCAQAPLEGEPCPLGVRCAEGLECDASSATCVPACSL